MDKICKLEFINTADNDRVWCDEYDGRCMGRSSCTVAVFNVDGSGMKQEKRFVLKCEKCGWIGRPNLEETGPHTKATCCNKMCGAYIKMLSKKDLEKLITESYRKVVKTKPIVKRHILNRADALDTYIDIRDKVKDIPVMPVVYRDTILTQLAMLAESHSAALTYIEELEREVSNDG